MGVLVVDGAEPVNLPAVGLFGSTLVVVAGALGLAALALIVLTDGIGVAPVVGFAVPFADAGALAEAAGVETAMPLVALPAAALTTVVTALIVVAFAAAVVKFAIGDASPTIVALRRFGCGHPSGGVAGADRTSDPFGVCCAAAVGVFAIVDARRWPLGAEAERAVRFGVDLEFAAEDLASWLLRAGGWN